jgi:hypothetical protein
MLEGSSTRQEAESASSNQKVRDVFANLLAKFEMIGHQGFSPRRRERFYELAKAYGQAVIADTRNEHLSRLVADLRLHSARLCIVAHSKPDRFEGVG